MKTKKSKISELWIDPKLTTIRHINLPIVSEYRKKYRNGVKFPLLIVQELPDNVNRIVSGNHRLTAMRKEYPDNHLIEVEVREYKNEAEVLRDFAVENASHGMRLDAYTKKKLNNAMSNEGITNEEIAKIFGISVRNVIKLGEGIVQVELKDGTIEERPAKRGLETEKPITEEQYKEEDSKSRGFPVVVQAEQLTRWLRNGFVLRTESNMKVLKELKKELDAFLKEKSKAA